MIRQSFLLLSLSAFYLGEVGCLLSSQDKLTDAHVLSELMVEKLDSQYSALVTYLETLDIRNQGVLISVESKVFRNAETKSNSSKKLCIRHSNGAMLAKFGNDEIDLFLANPQYHANLSKSGDYSAGSISLSSLRDSNLVMSNFLRADPTWKDRIHSISMTAMFFEYGGKPLKDQFNEWRLAKGTVSLKPSVRSNCKALCFDNWPGINGEMVFDVSESGEIHEMRGKNQESGISFRFRVEEFFETQGTIIPKRVSTDLENANPKWKSSVTTVWSEVPFEDVGFYPEQLFTEYYGIASPDVSEIRPRASEYSRWILFLLPLITATGIYLAWRIWKRND